MTITINSANGDILTNRQAAELLCISDKTLENLRTCKDGPTYTKVGNKHIIYRKEDVLAYKDANAFRLSRLSGNTTTCATIDLKKRHKELHRIASDMIGIAVLAFADYPGVIPTSDNITEMATALVMRYCRDKEASNDGNDE